MSEQLTFDDGDKNKAPARVGSDLLLLPFLQARDHSIAEGLLTQLIEEHADPIIAKILKSKTARLAEWFAGSQGNQDALEIASDLRSTLRRRSAHQQKNFSACVSDGLHADAWQRT